MSPSPAVTVTAEFAKLLFANAVLSVVVPVTVRFPETVALSATATVPPVESSVRLPVEVDTVLPFTVTLSTTAFPTTVRVPATSVVSNVVSPSTSKSPVTATSEEASTVVNEPAAAVDPPITTLSAVPPLMSAVSATNESMLAVPSIYKSFHS